MSNEPELVIAGNNDLASETARHAISSGIADPVYLWRSTADPLVGQAPVVILADPDERAGFARTALEAGCAVVSLPMLDTDQQIEEATADGRLSMISRLHGLPTMARLAADCRRGQPGRRYGIFATQRIPRDQVADVDSTLADLVVYVCSLVEQPLVSLRSSRGTFNGTSTDAWFLLSRFADETIATIEVAALLPAGSEPSGDLLVEVTGDDAVLRAAPERQSVMIHGNEGVRRQAWYAEPAGFLLDEAISVLGRTNPEVSSAALQLLGDRSRAVEESIQIPAR